VACGYWGRDGPGAAGNLHPHLTITTQHHGRRSVLLLRGDLDVCTRDRLRRAITRALQQDPRTLVVDLSGLDFIDCSGLSVLIWAHKRLAGQERQLLITGGKPIVRRLIQLAGADTYLHLSAPGGGLPSASSDGSGGGKRASPFARPPPEAVDPRRCRARTAGR
jgi:anti-anti-sigma factor